MPLNHHQITSVIGLNLVNLGLPKQGGRHLGGRFTFSMTKYSNAGLISQKTRANWSRAMWYIGPKSSVT